MNQGFPRFPLNTPLINEWITKLGYTAPSNIQTKVLEMIGDWGNGDGKVVASIIKSETGSGKTLAYLFGILNGIDIDVHEIQAVVIVPTRELALQTEDYWKHLSSRGLKCGVYIGGTANIPNKRKKEYWDTSNHVIVCTWGKLNSLLLTTNKQRQKHPFTRLNHWVIDEADKMLEQNRNNVLENTVKIMIDTIISNSSNTRSKTRSHITLCSASFSTAVIDFYNKFTAFNWISNESTWNTMSTKPNKIKEFYYVIAKEKHQTFFERKYEMWFVLLQALQSKYKQCLIFYNHKRKGEELSTELRSLNYKTCFIHGDLSQDQRQWIYEKIKRLNIKIIITTDWLSRGIDLTAVNFVVNFDMPFSDIEYYHRVGRTGRFYTDGISVSFVQQDQVGMFNDVIKNITELNYSDTHGDVERLIKEFDWMSCAGGSRWSGEEENKIRSMEEGCVEDIKWLMMKRRRDKYENQAVIGEWVDVVEGEDDKREGIDESVVSVAEGQKRGNCRGVAIKGFVDIVMCLRCLIYNW